MKIFKSKLEMYADKILLEADGKFSNKRAAPGEVKFATSDINKPHIVKAISELSKATGKPVAEIEKVLKDEMGKAKELFNHAPELFKTMEENLTESELFKLFSILKPEIKDAPQFNLKTFHELVQMIRRENERLTPIKNLNRIQLRTVNMIVIPGNNQKENEKWAGVDTAAASIDPPGDFIFYKPFMQQLLNYAHIKGLEPKGKKYTNNGGSIPPEWAYIEFLIMHEFFHYIQSDSKYAKELAKDPGEGLIINWVGDFRSNYELVKNGYEQLPLGLFNDEINFDVQPLYSEMFDIVKAGLAKLPKNKKKEIENLAADEHKPHKKQKQQKQKRGKYFVGQIVKNPDGEYGKITDIDYTSDSDGGVTIVKLSADEQKKYDKVNATE